MMYISDAFFVGEPNYLRAWAYLHHCGCHGDEWVVPTDWLMRPTTDIPTSPIIKPNQTRDNSKKRRVTNGGAITRNGRKAQRKGGTLESSGPEITSTTTMSIEVPTVPFPDFRVMRALGSGRNGVTFVARWQGKDVVLKQFDVGRDDGLGSFERELEAYSKLRALWGIHVPHVFFQSQSLSGGVSFLDLQKGRNIQEGDDVSSQKSLERILVDDYKFLHNDLLNYGNFVFLPQDDGTETLAVIDLEDSSDLS